MKKARKEMGSRRKKDIDRKKERKGKRLKERPKR